MPRLQHQVALVTGGGTGIGRAIAIALAAEGARVVVCGRRPDRLQNTVEAIGQAGGEALAVPADVSNPADVEHLIRAAREAFGGLDILVNNAGVGSGGPFHQAPVEEWDRTLAINLRGPMLMMKAALPIFRRQRHGQVLNISSQSGLNYYEGDSAYGLSKHALNDLAEYLQRENQDVNIRFLTICPGMVVTEMTENESGLDHSKCLYPEDIADLAVWMLTRRDNIKIGAPVLIQTMLNPWE